MFGGGVKVNIQTFFMGYKIFLEVQDIFSGEGAKFILKYFLGGRASGRYVTHEG